MFHFPFKFLNHQVTVLNVCMLLFCFVQTKLICDNTVTIRRTCMCVLSTFTNVGQIQESVRGEYCLCTELGARRHDVACLVHAEHSLRSSCVRARFITSTCKVRTQHMYFHVRPRVHNAIPPREFVLKIPLSLVIVSRTLLVRRLCLLGTSSVQLSK